MLYQITAAVDTQLVRNIDVYERGAGFSNIWFYAPYDVMSQ